MCQLVLIPLLLDDPLWALTQHVKISFKKVLIPLLLDDPLWAAIVTDRSASEDVLIPLLLDDPLWAIQKYPNKYRNTGLNPSFAG